VPYYPLAPDVLRSIVALKLGKIKRRIYDNYRAEMKWTPAVIEAIAKRCTEADTGARNIDNILTRTLLPELSTEFLARLAGGEKISSVGVDVKPDGNLSYELK